MNPILKMVSRHIHRVRARFCLPGHGGGRAVPPAARRMLGRSMFRADITQTMDVDDALAMDGTFAQARQRAAHTWGADRAWFLSGGSSAGVQAMMLATLSPGQTVLMGRDVHLSAVWGLVMSGAVPRFLPLRWDETGTMPLPLAVEDVPRGAGGPPAVSDPLFLVRPTYYGLCADVRTLAANRVVLVDEAWGGHLGFDPSGPESSLQAGADLVVCSAHKMLTALSGSALLFQRGPRVDPERLHHSVMAVSTTSPYYGMWVSLEATVDQMACRGTPLVQQAVRVAERLRAGLSRLSHVRLGPMGDPLHVLFGIEGWTGYALEEALLHRGVAIEMATGHHVLAVVGLSQTDADVDMLLRALARLVKGSTPLAPLPWTSVQQAMRPRDAFFAPRRRLPLKGAIGTVAAEPVAVYPPGIPLLVPGDIIHADVVAVLEASIQAGARVLGNSDPSMQTIQTVA